MHLGLLYSLPVTCSSGGLGDLMDSLQLLNDDPDLKTYVLLDYRLGLKLHALGLNSIAVVLQGNCSVDFSLPFLPGGKGLPWDKHLRALPVGTLPCHSSTGERLCVRGTCACELTSRPSRETAGHVTAPFIEATEPARTAKGSVLAGPSLPAPSAVPLPVGSAARGPGGAGSVPGAGRASPAARAPFCGVAAERGRRLRKFPSGEAAGGEGGAPRPSPAGSARTAQGLGRSPGSAQTSLGGSAAAPGCGWSSGQRSRSRGRPRFGARQVSG